MRIVSFNIQHGRCPSGKVDSSALATYCAGLRADVLGLQEVDIGLRRSGRIDQSALVARAAGMTKLFGRARRVGLRGSYGNALLVRGTVVDVEEILLPRVSRHEPRGAVVARGVLAEGEVTLAVTHLSVDARESRLQLQSVLSALSSRPGPQVLLGDFNLRAEEMVEGVSAAGLIVADPTSPTFPAAAPRARIDHVAVSGLQLLSVEVPAAAPVSDHRPLIVAVGSL